MSFFVSNQAQSFNLQMLPMRSKNDAGFYDVSFKQIGDNRNLNEQDLSELSIQNYMKNSIMLYNHYYPCGRFASLQYDGNGSFSGQISFSTDGRGEETEKLWVERVLNAFSCTFIFNDRPQTMQAGGYSYTGKSDLVEISIVDIPAFPSGANENTVSPNESDNKKTKMFFNVVSASEHDIQKDVENFIKTEVSNKTDEIRNTIINEAKEKKKEKSVKERTPRANTCVRKETPMQRVAENKKNEITRKILKRLNSYYRSH